MHVPPSDPRDTSIRVTAETAGKLRTLSYVMAAQAARRISLGDAVAAAVTITAKTIEDAIAALPEKTATVPFDAVVDDPEQVMLARAGLAWVEPFSDRRTDMTSYNLAMPGYLVGSRQVHRAFVDGRWHLTQTDEDGPTWTASGTSQVGALLALIAARCGLTASFDDAAAPPAGALDADLASFWLNAGDDVVFLVCPSDDAPDGCAYIEMPTGTPLADVLAKAREHRADAHRPAACGATPRYGCCDQGFCALGHDADQSPTAASDDQPDREADA